MSLFDEAERRPLSVSELTAEVRGAIEGRFASVWVEGEISNFKAAASGHWYFTVKDEGAQLRAKCFRGVNSRIRFRPSATAFKWCSFSARSAAAISRPAPSPCTRVGANRTLTVCVRRSLLRRMSRRAAPVGLVPTPTGRGSSGRLRLRS